MGLACAGAPGQMASQREGFLSRVSEGGPYGQPRGRHRRGGLGTRPLGEQERIQLSLPGSTSGHQWAGGGGGGEEPPPHSRPVCALQLQACLVCWVILGLIIGSWAPSGLGPLLGEGVGQAGAHFKLGQSPEIFAVW